MDTHVDIPVVSNLLVSEMPSLEAPNLIFIPQILFTKQRQANSIAQQKPYKKPILCSLFPPIPLPFHS